MRAGPGRSDRPGAAADGAWRTAARAGRRGSGGGGRRRGGGRRAFRDSRRSGCSGAARGSGGDGRGDAGRGSTAPAAEPRELLDEGGIRDVRPLDLTRDHPLLEQQHPVGELGDEVEVLLHHDDGDALLAVEAPQQLDDRVDDGGLDAFRRLVEEDELGLGDEAAGDREKLLLAARESPALAVQQRLEAREPGEDPPDRLLLLAAVGRDPHADVVLHAQVREDAAPLRHVPEPEPRPLARPLPGEVEARVADDPAGRGHDAHDGLEEGGLAHPVVAEHPDDLALLHREVDPVQHRHPAVPGAQRLDFEQRAHAPDPGLMPGVRDRPRGRGCRRRSPPSCPPSGSAPRGTRSPGPRSSG